MDMQKARWSVIRHTYKLLGVYVETERTQAKPSEAGLNEAIRHTTSLLETLQDVRTHEYPKSHEVEPEPEHEPPPSDDEGAPDNMD